MLWISTLCWISKGQSWACSIPYRRQAGRYNAEEFRRKHTHEMHDAVEFVRRNKPRIQSRGGFISIKAGVWQTLNCRWRPPFDSSSTRTRPDSNYNSACVVYRMIKFIKTHSTSPHHLSFTPLEALPKAFLILYTTDIVPPKNIFGIIHSHKLHAVCFRIYGQFVSPHS